MKDGQLFYGNKDGPAIKCFHEEFTTAESIFQTHGFLTEEIMVLSLEYVVPSFFQNEDYISRNLTYWG